MDELPIRENVPLAPLTTLELGGAARFFLRATTEAHVLEAYSWAADRGLPVAILGGGSNLVVADTGFEGLVVQIDLRGRSSERESDEVLVRAGAGETWDELVAYAVSSGWAGIECLSGIPGRVGATPLQNVSAYGQEVGDTLRGVRVLDLHSDGGAIVELDVSALGLGYRTSLLKRAAGRFVVLGATFALRPGGEVRTSYPEVARRLGPDSTLLEAREAVLALRRSRSMVIEPPDSVDPALADPNRRSVGSFFVNVVVPNERFEEIVELSLSRGFVRDRKEIAAHASGPAEVKVAAAWLIEKSGIPRGMRRGSVGVSTKHTLCLVHHGGGTTEELLGLAKEIQDRVRETFDLLLEPEPQMLGFEHRPLC